MDSGKLGQISNKDFEALWHAIDVDGSGEIDFVVSPNMSYDCYNIMKVLVEFSRIHLP